MSGVTLRRRQRAMGALVGAIVGDALGAPFTGAPAGAYTAKFPAPVLTGNGEMVGGGEWSSHTQMALLVAESWLSCGGIDADDLRARGLGGSPLTRTIPAAIAAAEAGSEVTTDVARHLCALTCDDPQVADACVALHLDVADAIAGRAILGASRSRTPSSLRSMTVETPRRKRRSPALSPAHAAGSVRSQRVGRRRCTATHPTAGRAGTTSSRCGRWLLRSPVSRRRTTWRSPGGPRVGPHLVDLRGLWVADLNGAARSHEMVPGAHVISLSRVGGPPQQPHWRRFYLVDSEDPDDNIALDAVIDDVMSTVTACIDAGEPVVVHCFAGESRTGLVLRAWLMQRDGLTEAEATARASELWPHLKTWNSAFTEALRRREASGTVR